MIETINKLNRISRQMLQEMGREPTPEELAERMPVSYTHLDVYKRQVPWDAIFDSIGPPG